MGGGRNPRGHHLLPASSSEMSGWLFKQGAKVGGWQKRYFVLYDNCELHYFEGSSMENIQRKGRIRMAQATELVRLKPDDSKDFTFIIKVPGRDWVLDPGSAAAWAGCGCASRPTPAGRPTPPHRHIAIMVESHLSLIHI